MEMTPPEMRSGSSERLQRAWKTGERWAGIERGYGADEVIRLRGSVEVEHSLARQGAEKLWRLLHTESHVPALGAITGNQAVQMVKAGLKAIYLSGWQVAGDGNLAESPYPDQSLYPVNSVPSVVRRINNALRRADQIQWAEGNGDVDWLVPIVADAEAGLGGPLNAFELMNSMIEAGAAGVHFEDQLSSEKKCGHLGGKVLVPTGHFVRTLQAARLAADVCNVPTVLVARTDSLSATLLTSDVDGRDHEFILGERTPEGFPRPRRPRAGDRAHARVRAVRRRALVRDVDARSRRGARVRSGNPRAVSGQVARVQLLAVVQLEARSRRRGDRVVPAQAGGRRLPLPVRDAGRLPRDRVVDVRARRGVREGMTAYVRMQEHEFELEEKGYTATRHQREVGAGYFDLVAQAVSGGESSTLALVGSTEEAQFAEEAAVA
jgi:isocitrate/methylisocitrate lyase